MLSIIIPVYNREKLLQETLNSVLAQTRDDWECILIDDHSTDATESVILEYCRRDPRFRYIRRPDEAPKGPSSCRNAGYAVSKGEFVYFLDSDDLIGECFMESFLPELEKDDSLDYVLLRFIRFDGDIKRIVRRSGELPDDMTVQEAMAAFRIAQGTQYFIWRRSFLARQDHLWREDLSFGEDRELNFRLVADARKGKFLAEPILVYYRRNRKGLCFVRRFEKERLMDTLEVCRSFIAVSRTGKVSDRAKTYYARYLVKNMRDALKFGDRVLMNCFYELSRDLLPDSRTKRRLERYRHYWLFYAMIHRPPQYLAALIAKLF